jgi:small subunit ribosomal protein S8
MTMTDPIADLLTRIRNAILAKHKSLSIPASNIKKEIVRILNEEGYVGGFAEKKDNRQGMIEVQLKYGTDKKSLIHGIERVSRPGRRVYCSKDEIPLVLRGLGINILSTSKGVMTGRDSAKEGVGGEILCNVW